MMLIVFVVVIIVVVLMFLSLCLNLLNPACGGGYFLKVELMGVDDEVEVYVAVVAFEYLGLGLDGTDDLLEVVELLRFHFCGLVEQDDVAEFYLLDYERGEVFLVEVVLQQVGAVGKLVFHAERIHHGDDAVEAQNAVLDILGAKCGDGADGLGDGGWLADAAGLDHDIVETLHVNDFLQLFHEVHLQRAADAAVLQAYERIVLLVHHAAFLDEGSVDVHLADVVDDDCKLDAFLVSQNLIEQSGLSAA